MGLHLWKISLHLRLNELKLFHPIENKKGEVTALGSCGKVYRCLNLNNGDLLAVKTVKISKDERTLRREVNRLKQEIKILRGLSHQNIVKYYGLEVNEKI